MKKNNQIRSNQNIFFLTIVAIVAIISIVILTIVGNYNFTGQNTITSKDLQTENTDLAGQAIKMINSKIALKNLDFNVKPEICDNNIDDNGNGKVDCQEFSCDGFIFLNNQKQDAACVDGVRQTCGGKNNPYGTVLEQKVYNKDLLCYKNGVYSTWGICNSGGGDFNKDKKYGNNGLIKMQGDVITTASSEFICTWRKKTDPKIGEYNFAGWVACGDLKKGTGGANAVQGEVYDKMFQCSNKKWSKEVCDNHMDDDGDGLSDCNDPKCTGFISVPSQNSLSIGINYAEQICLPKTVGIKNVNYNSNHENYPCYPIGSEIPAYNLLCVENNNEYIWAECDTDGKLAKPSAQATKIFKKGQMANYNSKNDKIYNNRYLCYNDDWLGCNPIFGAGKSSESGDAGTSIGYTVEGYSCYDGAWKKG